MDSAITPHSIRVRRTARYYTLGPTHGFPRELWIVCHGYGQLAGKFLRQFAPLDDGSARRRPGSAVAILPRSGERAAAAGDAARGRDVDDARGSAGRDRGLHRVPRAAHDGAAAPPRGRRTAHRRAQILTGHRDDVPMAGGERAPRRPDRAVGRGHSARDGRGRVVGAATRCAVDARCRESDEMVPESAVVAEGTALRRRRRVHAAGIPGSPDRPRRAGAARGGFERH